MVRPFLPAIVLAVLAVAWPAAADDGVDDAPPGPPVPELVITIDLAAVPGLDVLGVGAVYAHALPTHSRMPVGAEFARPFCNVVALPSTDQPTQVDPFDVIDPEGCLSGAVGTMVYFVTDNVPPYVAVSPSEIVSFVA